MPVMKFPRKDTNDLTFIYLYIYVLCTCIYYTIYDSSGSIIQF